MLYSQFTKCQSNKNWEKFRKQRNCVTNLKRKSMKTYFLERCSGGTKSGYFWKTIKPFFSKKGFSGEQTIVLNKSDKIVNNQKEVANHFNNLLSTVAENIGKDTVYDPADHPSLLEIKKQKDCTNKFVFEKVTTDKVEKIINNINIKKATGVNGIPAKIIKCSKSIIAPQITSSLNMSIDQSVFPDKLKKAQVTPLYKKNDPLLKTNYRPVSVLCICSKIFEKIFEQQLSDFFGNIFNPYLCAFGRGHGCQTILLMLLEDWRNALDKNQYVAAVLIDLSKAFDCLPHDISLDKLSAYGMSTDSVSLLESYLSNRKQQIKIYSILSSWSDIQKGVPQGSILGPLHFNVFINDIFYFVKNGTLYNYADDNTLSYGHPDFNVLISVLESESNVLIDWFKVNKMQANPDKFRVLAFGKKTFDKNMKICIQNSTLSCEGTVNLLGIEIDYRLNFDIHISSICRKTSQQLNILKTLGPIFRQIKQINFIPHFHSQ